MSITKGMMSSDTVEWATPIEFFNHLDSEFGFTLDVCATADNAKCDRYFTKEDDGLKQSWKGENAGSAPFPSVVVIFSAQEQEVA